MGKRTATQRRRLDRPSISKSVIVRNSMDPAHRKRLFAIRSSVRRGDTPCDDAEYVSLRREYERNRPRYISLREAAALRKLQKTTPKSRDKVFLARKQADWRLANPGKHRESCAKYYRSNREKILRRVSQYERKRLSEDPLYRYVKGARRRVWIAMRKGKTKALQAAVGCDRGTFTTHISSLFQPGMTWENYGFYGWHIDHISPVSSFNLTDKEQIRACFHYTNLQPLWARDNWRKGSKLA